MTFLLIFGQLRCSWCVIMRVKYSYCQSYMNLSRKVLHCINGKNYMIGKMKTLIRNPFSRYVF